MNVKFNSLGMSWLILIFTLTQSIAQDKVAFKDPSPNTLSIDLASWFSNINKFSKLARVPGNSIQQGKKLELVYDHKVTLRSSFSFRLMLDYNQSSTYFKQQTPIFINDTINDADYYFFLLSISQGKAPSASDYYKESYYPDGGYEIGVRYKNLLYQQALSLFWSCGINLGAVNYLKSEERFIGNISTIKYTVENSGFPWWNSIEREYAIHGKVVNYGKKMKANYSTFSVGFGVNYKIPKSKISLGYEMDLNRRITVSPMSKGDLNKVWTNHSVLLSYSF
ncbi:MAG: hypothetical protein IPL25_12605 [Saprospiraceae bacterium]|nr:hypothetical protein [Candidatus Vicinibacter affinis]